MTFAVLDLGTGATRLEILDANGMPIRPHKKVLNDGLFIPGKPHWTFDAERLEELRKIFHREINIARHQYPNISIQMVATQGARNLSKADRKKFQAQFNIPGAGNLKIITGEEESHLCAEAVSANMPGVGGLSVHMGNGSLDLAQLQANGNIPVCVTRPDGLTSQRSNILPIINDMRITCPQGLPIHATGTTFSNIIKELAKSDPSEFSKAKKFYNLRIGAIETMRDDLTTENTPDSHNKLYALNIILGFAERFGSSCVILHQTGIREALVARMQRQLTPQRITSPELLAAHF
jgi:hypothetical protein